MSTKVETVRTNRPNQPTYEEAPVKLADAAQDAMETFRDYAKERPDVVALWALGIGFVLGWKLKPW